MDVLDKLWEIMKSGAILALAVIVILALTAGIMMVGHSLISLLW